MCESRAEETSSMSHSSRSARSCAVSAHPSYEPWGGSRVLSMASRPLRQSWKMHLPIDYPANDLATDVDAYQVVGDGITVSFWDALLVPVYCCRPQSICLCALWHLYTEKCNAIAKAPCASASRTGLQQPVCVCVWLKISGWVQDVT